MAVKHNLMIVRRGSLDPIYLDYNATTAIDDAVLDNMLTTYRDNYGNPSSAHDIGQTASDSLEEARESVMELINAKSGDLVFTSGGTESNNLALFGFLENYQNMSNHIMVSAIEHPAILNIAEKLMQENICEVSIIPVDIHGQLDLEQLEAEMRETTRLVSVMMVNNITGAIQDVKKISEIVHHHGAAFHSDCVQACGKVAIDVNEMGLDLVSLSSHKFHGPKGVGALYVSESITLKNRIVGGGQEGGMRSGTENVPGIIGMGKAASLFILNVHNYYRHCCEIRDFFLEELHLKVPAAAVLSNKKYCVPSTMTISLPHLRGQAIVEMMNIYGVAVSACSACSTNGKKVTCPPLLAMGYEEEVAKGAVRMSFGRFTTKEEIIKASDVLKLVYEKLKQTTGK